MTLEEALVKVFEVKAQWVLEDLETELAVLDVDYDGKRGLCKALRKLEYVSKHDGRARVWVRPGFKAPTNPTKTEAFRAIRGLLAGKSECDAGVLVDDLRAMFEGRQLPTDAVPNYLQRFGWVRDRESPKGVRRWLAPTNTIV